MVLGGLFALVVAIALFLVYYHMSPASVIRFYLGITQRINIDDGACYRDHPAPHLVSSEFELERPISIR